MSEDAERFPHTLQCHHLKQHTIVIRNHGDEMAKALFHHDGWERAGYCFAYMPEWLRPRYETDPEERPS